MELRNFAFNQGVLPSVSFDKPIISVGNISMGGTGKTPMVAYLVDLLQSENKKIGIVSRGYGGKYSGVQRVKEGYVEAFGDEVSMLQARYPQVPIYVCKKRVQAIEKLIEDEVVDIIIADDGFQHRYFKRSIDIVLMDSTDKRLKVFPSGRLREPMSGLKRADIVVITRSDRKEKTSLYKEINEYVSEDNIYWGKTVPYDIQSFEGNAQDSLGDESVVLFSGIGNPKGFEKTVKSFSINYNNHYIYKDHFDYTQKKIDELEKKHPESSFLCTEKDFIKIKNFQLKNNYYYLKINTEIIGNKSEFDAKIRSYLT